MQTRTQKLYKAWAAVQIAVLIIGLGGSSFVPLIASANNGDHSSHNEDSFSGNHQSGDNHGDSNHGDNGHGDNGDGHNNGDGNHDGDGHDGHGDDNHGGDGHHGGHHGDNDNNDGDNDGDNDDDTTPPTPTPSADVSITKAVSTTSPALGANVIYTLVVTNNGTDTATGVVATDVLSTNLVYVSDDSAGAYVPATGVWTIGTLANGSSTTLHITATDSTTTAVNNTATVTSTSIDPVSGNNTSQTVTVTTVPATTTDGGDTGGTGTTTDNGGGNTGGTGGGDTGGSSPAPQTTSGTNGGGGGGVISGPLSYGYSNGGGNGSGLVLGASTGPSDCSAYLTGNIRVGQNNDTGEVLKLQTFLNNFENFQLALTGVYDAPTVAAVDAFQQKYSTNVLQPWGVHQPTGFVYHTTKKEINEIYCKFTKQFPLTSSQEAEIAHVKAQGMEGGAPAHHESTGVTAPVAPTTDGTAPTTDVPSSNTGGFWHKVKSFIFGN